MLNLNKENIINNYFGRNNAMIKILTNKFTNILKERYER